MNLVQQIKIQTQFLALTSLAAVIALHSASANLRAVAGVAAQPSPKRTAAPTSSAAVKTLTKTTSVPAPAAAQVCRPPEEPASFSATTVSNQKLLATLIAASTSEKWHTVEVQNVSIGGWTPRGIGESFVDGLRRIFSQSRREKVVIRFDVIQTAAVSAAAGGTGSATRIISELECEIQDNAGSKSAHLHHCTGKRRGGWFSLSANDAVLPPTLGKFETNLYYSNFTAPTVPGCGR